jgi:hypothetical protein
MLTLRAGATVLCMLALTACRDGYPTEDLPQIDPALMSTPQLLAALNDLGQTPHLGKRWRFDLRVGCELEITVRDGKRVRHHVPLEGASIATQSADGITEIRLVPEGGADADAVTAMQTRRWPETVRARALLTALEQRCGDAEPPMP